MSVYKRDNLASLAKQNPKLTEWLKKNGEEFEDALEMWSTEEDMLLMLIKMRDTFGEWKGPDSIDWAWKDVVKPFIYENKEIVNVAELRSAVRLLVAKYNTACQHIENLERVRRVPLPRRFHIQPAIPRPR